MSTSDSDSVSSSWSIVTLPSEAGAASSTVRGIGLRKDRDGVFMRRRDGRLLVPVAYIIFSIFLLEQVALAKACSIRY